MGILAVSFAFITLLSQISEFIQTNKNLILVANISMMISVLINFVKDEKYITLIPIGILIIIILKNCIEFFK